MVKKTKTTVKPEVRKEIERYIGNLKKQDLYIKKVILFGSFAKGKGGKWSDIDLCIVSPDFKDPWQASEFLWKYRDIKDVRYVIEPVGFSEKEFVRDDDDFLIRNIKRDGVEIKV
jgi:predicted nucleotidyltransferase